MTLHTLPEFGLPYAWGGTDEQGDYVACTACGLRFHDQDRKAAVLAYGIHFEQMAGEGK